MLGGRGERLDPDQLLDALPLDVLVLELLGEASRRRGVGREQEIQRELRLAEPPGGVEARREPEADVLGGDPGLVELGQRGERQREPGRLRAVSVRRPAATRMRFSSTSGTRSAIVPSATRSSRSRGSKRVGSARRRVRSAAAR